MRTYIIILILVLQHTVLNEEEEKTNKTKLQVHRAET